MNQADVTRSQKALIALWSALDQKNKMSDNLQQIYIDALRDLGADAIVAACGLALSQFKWFPKPVELRKLANPHCDPAVRAAAAFEVAKDLVTNRRPLDCQDKLINATIRHLGGLDAWAAIGRDEMTRWKRKEFIEVYVQLCGYHTLTSSQVAPLASRITHTKGYKERMKAIGIDVDLRPKIVACEYVAGLPAIEYSQEPSNVAAGLNKGSDEVETSTRN